MGGFEVGVDEAGMVEMVSKGEDMAAAVDMTVASESFVQKVILVGSLGPYNL